MKNDLLRRYAHWVITHARSIAIMAFVLSAISLSISFLFLESRTGILDLYAKEDPAARRFIEYSEKFGAVETLVIVLEGGEISARQQAIESLVKKLQQDPHHFIQHIFYKVDFSFFEKHFLQFLSEEQAQDLLKEIKKPDGGLKNFFAAQSFNDYLTFLNRSMERSLESPSSEAQLKAQDISGLEKGLYPIHLLADYLKNEKSSIVFSLQDWNVEKNENQSVDEKGYLASDDQKMHVVFIRPSDHKQDHKEASALVKFVRQQVDQVKQAFPGLEIGVTGGPALNKDQFEISERDMTWASAFAFISTSIIFFLAFYSLWRPALGLLTLALSLTWSFGMTTLTIGHLNMFSLAFIVILVGQGTYYGVHVVSRYEEELRRGLAPPQALEETIIHIFGNISTSTITTSAAFFATTLVKLEGFAELGWIAGMGILLSSLGMQMVLPAFLLLFDRKAKKTGVLAKRRSFKNGKYGFGKKMKTFIFKAYPAFILIVVFSAAWGGYQFYLNAIPFDSNVLNLQAKNTEAVRYEKKLSQTSLTTRAGIFLADSFEEAKKIAQQAENLPSVQKVSWVQNSFPEGDITAETYQKLRASLLALQPAPLQIPDGRNFMSELLQLKINLERISEKALYAPNGDKILASTESALLQIEQLLKESKKLDPPVLVEKIKKFQQVFLGNIRQTFLQAARANKISRYDLAPEILSSFVSNKSESAFSNQVYSLLEPFYKKGLISQSTFMPQETYAIYAYPKVNIWERKPLEKFVSDLKSVSENVTGPPLMFHEILSLVRSDYFNAALYSALAIFIIFLINFRSLPYAILAFLPLVLGCLSLLGLMKTCGLSFNIANLIALPMVLGIGADNGVHMIQRFREEKAFSIDFLFQSTGKALFITYLDTLTSFFGIAIAQHQGLAQLGRIVILGITCCTIIGVLFLPSIMVMIINRKKVKLPLSPLSVNMREKR